MKYKEKGTLKDCLLHLCITDKREKILWIQFWTNIPRRTIAGWLKDKMPKGDYLVRTCYLMKFIGYNVTECRVENKTLIDIGYSIFLGYLKTEHLLNFLGINSPTVLYGYLIGKRKPSRTVLNDMNGLLKKSELSYRITDTKKWFNWIYTKRPKRKKQ